MRATTAEDVAVMLAYARKVVFVPGYGLAVAQAQHDCRELGELLEERGVDVKYAIHPVAGRMPGHMNVLLAEANVPYDQLHEMDEINAGLPQTDVVLVIGANDVVNPAAKTDPSSPIYGMPILEVEQARGSGRRQAQHEPRLRRHRQPALLRARRRRCCSPTRRPRSSRSPPPSRPVADRSMNRSISWERCSSTWWLAARDAERRSGSPGGSS